MGVPPGFAGLALFWGKASGVGAFFEVVTIDLIEGVEVVEPFVDGIVIVEAGQAGLVQVLVSGGWLVDGFVFDGGEFAQACLSASAVVLGFDPVADGGLELVSAVPVLLIKDVLLE